MKKNTTVPTAREQGSKGAAEPKARGLKVRTSVKAGAKGDPERIALNHNETVAKPSAKAQREQQKRDAAKTRGLKVRTNVKAGAPGDDEPRPPGKLGLNHNETVAKPSAKAQREQQKRDAAKARGLKVRTSVKAGAPGDDEPRPPGKLGLNHNETLAS